MYAHIIPLFAVKAAAHYGAQLARRKTMTTRALTLSETGEHAIGLVLDAMDCAARVALFDQFKIAKSRECK